MSGCGTTNCFREFLTRWHYGEFPGEGITEVSMCDDCRQVVKKFEERREGDGL